ncbi:MAG: leucine-rich repeat domain-containing protein [Prevotella sp.]|nr:leucine-rich repeat domain-containing protein [Prevotella sp.]
MASLIHALEFLSVSMERIICVVDSEHPEKNVHYDKTLINEEGKDDNEDEEDNNDEDDMPIFDEHDVGYSKDGKKLVCCRYTFNDTRYEVPDGVEEIADFAFLSCRHFVELSIPRSVRIIGDYIFGNGGQIVIRD